MKRISAVTAAVFVAGCAQVVVSLPYDPKTTEEIEGTIAVRDFRYFPKEGVAQNEIRETAMGRILITEPVGQFIANAVRRELRQAGVSLKSGACELDGEVNEFLIDSLGYSSDYVTDIRYILYNKSGEAVFDNAYQVKFNASKFVTAEVVFANINKAVADNIGQLLKDETFQSLAAACQK